MTSVTDPKIEPESDLETGPEVAPEIGSENSGQNIELEDAEQQAAKFERVREAHKTEVAEDYVELIDDLINANGEARVVELAERMGVSHATVNKIIQRLQREGLVISKPYRSIFLTDNGRALAQAARRRHEIVVRFLKAAGVSDATAEIDAEGVEHHVSEETLECLSALTLKIEK
ncbi:manganese-binding transcriptional regulator MntR [Kiloniella sp. EL199]|uniref:manganese-binding transcriptional regulator MntR n=1 Tax=Kiloniella sp. EL199 TaxID=2107581 RepID=UPI000EA25B83|nr:manganese-binding transcriptional regulator MntR [Kiloniella sp. EL199]